MSKTRVNRPLDWKATGGPYPPILTRQRKRAISRQNVWSKFSGVNTPSDHHGLIPRNVRREMALELSKRVL